jgi:Tol biopolymer transport system component
VNDHNVTVVLERLIEPLDDEVGSWDDVLRRAAEPRPEYCNDVLDLAGPAAGGRLTLDHSLARRSRRRLLVLVTAALVVVVATASAFGTVRDLFFGSGGSSFASPVWSPDGRKIYFLSHRWGDRGLVSTEVYVMNANGGGQRNLTSEWGLQMKNYAPIWSPDARKIVFVHSPCYAVPGACTGDTWIYLMDADGSGLRRVARGARYRKVYTGQRVSPDVPSPVWSPNGRKIVFGSDRDGDIDIYTMNADGRGQRRLTRSTEMETSLAWSPDGRRIAFVGSRYHGPGSPPGSEIYVMNADGSGLRNITPGPGGGGSPAWSPDGRKIAFRSERTGKAELYLVNPDGSGLVRLTRNPSADGDPVWSPDGKNIYFVRGRSGKSDVHAMNADGSRQRNLSRNPEPPHDGRDNSPAVSPDGRRIVFVSERDGSGQIYVMNADGSGLRRLTRHGQ